MLKCVSCLVVLKSSHFFLAPNFLNEIVLPADTEFWRGVPFPDCPAVGPILNSVQIVIFSSSQSTRKIEPIPYEHFLNKKVLSQTAAV